MTEKNNHIVNQLPKDWKWVKLGETGKILSGGTPSTSIPEYWNGNINWIAPSDLTRYKNKSIRKGKKSITESGLKNSSARLMPKGSVLFSSRAPIGYVVIADSELCTNQGFKSIIPNENIISDFLYYFLLASKRNAEQVASGTTFKEISLSKFSELSFPLPHKPTQQAIVSKIEELFSEIKKGIESLFTAQKQLKTYRQSVLKWAFEGKLTNKNVKEGEFPRDWKLKKISDITKIETGTTPSKSNPVFYGNQYPFYKPTDLEAGENVYKSNDGLTKLGVDAARYVPENSTLVTCIGATIGKTGLIKKGGGFNQQINAIVPNETMNPKFVYYQTIGLKFQKQILDNASATTLPIINKGKFQILEMVVCSIEEQRNIVREIESRLSVADKMEESINESLQQAEALRQSILKKAFEGKLV